MFRPSNQVRSCRKCPAPLTKSTRRGALFLRRKVANPSQLREAVDLERRHAAVVMSHHLPSDALYLCELAESDAPDYVGLLGPAARRNRLAHELGALAERLRSRLRSPVGLALGAVTPEGIALAILGQIHAWLADIQGGDSQWSKTLASDGSLLTEQVHASAPAWDHAVQ